MAYKLMKSISFRFDVDTDLCFSSGVPNLIKLAEDKGCSFTFYVNVGRAIDYGTIFNPRAVKHKVECAKKLTSVKKFGILPVINFLLRNRVVVDDEAVIRMLLDSPHEVGLHGGRNHASWHRYASGWSSAQLEDEIKWGVDNFFAAFGRYPHSFSSPGWNSPKLLPAILTNMQFKYFADLHGVDCEAISFESELPNIGTQLAGEPGGVGCLEHLCALGMKNKDAVQYFMSNLMNLFKSSSHVTVYDHPGFAGVRGRSLMLDILDAVLSEGVNVLRVDEYFNSVQSR